LIQIPFTFFWVSDSHHTTRPDLGELRLFSEALDPKLERILDEADSAGAAFIISGGDNTECYGSRATNETCVDELIAKYDEHVTDYYLVRGNHDCYNDADAVLLATWLSKLGYDKEYYSFDYGTMHFIILDSCKADDSGTEPTTANIVEFYIDSDQRDWLTADLAANSEKQTFVFMHVPVYPTATASRIDASDDNYVEPVCAALVAGILEKAGNVAAVFQGHKHRSTDSGTENGIKYFTIQGLVDGVYVADPLDHCAGVQIDIDEYGNVDFTEFGDPNPQSAWPATSWQMGGNMARQLKITIDHTKVSGSEDLTDFPVLIAGDNMPSEFWAHVQSDGSDIWCQLADGTKLSCDFVSMDVGSEKMELWVKIPTLSHDADTIFYLNFGNGDLSETVDADTWDASYVMVQHMSEDPEGAGECMLDSTDCDNDFDPTSLASDKLIDGFFSSDSAIRFDGSGDYMTGTAGEMAADLNGAGAITLEMVVRPTDVDGAAEWLFATMIDGEGTGMSMGIHTDAKWRLGGRSIKDLSYKAIYSDSETAQNNTWVHITGILDFADDEIRLYINGVIAGIDETANFNQTSYTPDTPTTPDRIACAGNGTGKCSVDIDECRVSKAERSADYLLTSYRSMSAPSTFYACEEWQIPITERVRAAANSMGGEIQ